MNLYEIFNVPAGDNPKKIEGDAKISAKNIKYLADRIIDALDRKPEGEMPIGEMLSHLASNYRALCRELAQLGYQPTEPPSSTATNGEIDICGGH